jgi:hypothetical protein
MTEDPQAQRVYELESTFSRESVPVTYRHKDLCKLANAACRRWHVPRVQVRFLRSSKRYGEYRPYTDPPTVALFRKGSFNGYVPETVLHEIAHHIEKTIFAGSSPDAQLEHHNARFVAIVRDLYDYYKIMPRAAFTHLAKVHRVGIAGSCRPSMKRPAARARGTGDVASAIRCRR